MDGFIFVGTNFRGLNKNHTFVGFKICCHSIFLHNSHRKPFIRGYWNPWNGPSTKTTKIGTQRKLSHPQYYAYTLCFMNYNHNAIQYCILCMYLENCSFLWFVQGLEYWLHWNAKNFKSELKLFCFDLKTVMSNQQNSLAIIWKHRRPSINVCK